jgi:hypothetical protein
MATLPSQDSQVKIRVEWANVIEARPADAVATSPTTPRLYWLTTPHKASGQRRHLVEVVGDGHTRTSHKTGRKTAKVLTRTYLARSKRWSARRLKPAEWFNTTNTATIDDPFVRDAVRHRI